LAGVRTVIDCFILRAISVAHAKAVTAAGNLSMQIRQSATLTAERAVLIALRFMAASSSSGSVAGAEASDGGAGGSTSAG
jgi:hypothetical protein